MSMPSPLARPITGIQGFEAFVDSTAKSSEHKVEVTRALGATFVHRRPSQSAGLRNKIGNIDVVYEAAGASKLAFDTIPHLGDNGVFIFTGILGRRAPIRVDVDLMMLERAL
jgi:D-arabinose 1-dehydrogenase-like Zn-dependent alcohol dehydrogenase